MLNLSAHTIADALHAPRGLDAPVESVCFDSRAARTGALFVALPGEAADGHRFVGSALAQGASAALVRADWTPPPAVAPERLIAVAETYQGLGDLAMHWRARFNLPVLALTGSNGKTTVKGMLQSILLAHTDADHVLVTLGNFNNHIGVPITLLRLRPEHRYAVVEAGMNHFGELAYLTRLIAPSIAIINNAGPAHLEGVGDLAGVARAKAEVFEGLASSGTAIWNGDDTQASTWQTKARALGISHTVSFGRAPQNTLRGDWTSTAAGDPMRVQSSQGSIEILLPVAGEHNRMNALAATAGALTLGVPLATIARGLAAFTPVAGRQREHFLPNGARLIDDAYNANPASMRAAFDVLQSFPSPRVLVMGHMAELGENTLALHADILQSAQAKPFDQIFCIGERFANACAKHSTRTRFFTDRARLQSAIEAALQPGASVLVKGAHALQLEALVEAVLNNKTQGGA